MIIFCGGCSFEWNLGFIFGSRFLVFIWGMFSFFYIRFGYGLFIWDVCELDRFVFCSVDL